MHVYQAGARVEEGGASFTPILTPNEREAHHHGAHARAHDTIPPRQVLDAAFAAADPSNSGVVSYETVQDVLGANDLELNDQVPRCSRDHT